ncbi:MAG: seryl-tRNA synthetase [Acidimicrobiaceae bacterium]|jgi:seryl-tRNA synthetase|nr:seryl-tRNA synthetase [Acidimicrobiaceae bacterium]
MSTAAIEVDATVQPEMIDIQLVRNDLEGVKKALARKKVDPAELDRLADADRRSRQAGGRRDDLRGRINELSKEVGGAHRSGDKERAASLAAESRALGDQLKDMEAEAEAADRERRDLLLRIPNLPADDALDGASEADNRVVRVEHFDPDSYQPHQRVPHWEIGAELGILDNERAVKISGSMFTMPRGGGATLARALCQYALDRNADAFEEIRPPTLVTSATLTATGQLPKFADDAYHIERDDLWAIPTAEVPLTSLGRDEIFDEADLPVRLMAYTPCYRREAGSAGRDTRGMLRSHEFDKVEVLAYTTADQARPMHQELMDRIEALIAGLGLAYRWLEISTGDLGQSHARQFDLEAYAPGCDMWLEVSSVSWFTDYQARRANIRYRPAGQRHTAMVHTLNGSALAVPRVWAAIVESHRQADGSIRVPEGLLPYFRGATAITRSALRRG